MRGVQRLRKESLENITKTRSFAYCQGGGIRQTRIWGHWAIAATEPKRAEIEPGHQIERCMILEGRPPKLNPDKHPLRNIGGIGEASSSMTRRDPRYLQPLSDGEIFRPYWILARHPGTLPVCRRSMKVPVDRLAPTCSFRSAMSGQSRNVKRRKAGRPTGSPSRLIGLKAAAVALGCTWRHLHFVLTGKRQSKSLTARYAKLQESQQSPSPKIRP